jgi:peptide/nickel transport system substrate-binding protein
MASMVLGRLLAVWCLLASGAGALADACPPALAKGTQPSKRLLLAAKGDPASLDPYASNDSFTLGLLGNVYEGLVKRSPAGGLVGALAESWEMVDDTHWRFHLRQNVKFQKGQEFTADDVVYSAIRVRKNGSALKSLLPPDAKVTKVDEHTVEVILAGRNLDLIAEWDSWYILSKPWIEPAESNDPSKFDAQQGLAATSANGTGPYIVNMFKSGERTEFAPNPNWWNGGPLKFDLVELCPMPSTGDRLDALLSTGPVHVDWIDSVPPADWQRILQSANAKGAISEDFQVVFLGFDVARDQLTGPNQGDPNPFKEPDVRKAIYQAIDVASIQSDIMRNYSIGTSSLVPATLFPPASTLNRWNYDPAAAKALLASSKYPDGFEIVLDCPNSRFTNDVDICNAVKRMLYPMGISVTVNKLNWKKFAAKVLAGGGYDTSFFLFGWMPGSLDALNVLSNLVSCREEKTGKGLYNVGNYCNSAVDDLVAKAAGETDPGKRSAFVLQALQLVHQDIALVPLHQQEALTGLSKLVDVGTRKDGRIRFEEFDKRPH